MGTSPETPWKITREIVYEGNFALADSPWEDYKNNTESWLKLIIRFDLSGYHSPLTFQHFATFKPERIKKTTMHTWKSQPTAKTGGISTAFQEQTNLSALFHPHKPALQLRKFILDSA